VQLKTQLERIHSFDFTGIKIGGKMARVAYYNKAEFNFGLLDSVFVPFFFVN